MNTDIIPTEAATPDGMELIQSDVICRSCGYNLRGLSPEGRCPECGQEIALSLRDDLLRYANADWLQKVRLGTRLFWLPFIISACAAITAPVVLHFASHSMLAIAGPLYFTIFCICSGLFCAGIFLITIPDPSGIGESTYGKSRKTTRVLLVIVMALLYALIVRGVFGSFGLGLMANRLAAIAGYALPVAIAVFLFSLGTFFSGLAARGHHVFMGKSGRLLRTLVIIEAVCVGVFILSGTMRFWPGLPIAALPFLVTFAVTLVILWRLSRLLKNTLTNEICEQKKLAGRRPADHNANSKP